jgi:DNA-binding response OmpR family regulator
VTPTGQAVAHRVLLVDDDAAVRGMIHEALTRKGFDVVAAECVPEALQYIATEKFDVLVSDLHMPAPADGFTVVSAMRHSQPHALTMLVSGYPDVQRAMSAILLDVDEILVKPFAIARLTETIHDRVLNRKPIPRFPKERVGAILLRCSADVVLHWLNRAKQSPELKHLLLSDAERTGHLPRLVEDLATRLSKSSAATQDSDAAFSETAVAHGALRHAQGYTPAMLVYESRILQVTIFGTLQSNLNYLDFSLLLPDVMTIADEVDAQLTQSMESYMKSMKDSTAAA